MVFLNWRVFFFSQNRCTFIRRSWSAPNLSASMGIKLMGKNLSKQGSIAPEEMGVCTDEEGDAAWAGSSGNGTESSALPCGALAGTIATGSRSKGSAATSVVFNAAAASAASAASASGTRQSARMSDDPFSNAKPKSSSPASNPKSCSEHQHQCSGYHHIMRLVRQRRPCPISATEKRPNYQPIMILYIHRSPEENAHHQI